MPILAGRVNPLASGKRTHTGADPVAWARICWRLAGCHGLGMLAEIAIPFLAFIVGILVYALASNGKLVEIGRALLWCGALVSLLVVAHHMVRV